MHIGKDLIAASATPLVLAILTEGESYGYAILKRVAELSDGQLRWTDGMLYPVLHRLERLGNIEGRLGAFRERAPAPVLPDHGRRRGAVGGAPPPVAGRGPDAARDLAFALELAASEPAAAG